MRAGLLAVKRHPVLRATVRGWGSLPLHAELLFEVAQPVAASLDVQHVSLVQQAVENGGGEHLVAGQRRSNLSISCANRRVRAQEEAPVMRSWAYRSPWFAVPGCGRGIRRPRSSYFSGAYGPGPFEKAGLTWENTPSTWNGVLKSQHRSKPRLALFDPLIGLLHLVEGVGLGHHLHLALRHEIQGLIEIIAPVLLAA